MSGAGQSVRQIPVSDSPLEAYVAWFEALPPEISRDLASVLMQFFPGDLLTSNLVTNDPTAGFIPRLKRLSVNPAKEIGLVGALVAFTDIAFLERGAPDRSEQTGAMLDVLDFAQENLSTGDPSTDEALGQWIAEQQLRHPLRAKQWARERDGWERLRDEALSPARLLDALRGRPSGSQA